MDLLTAQDETAAVVVQQMESLKSLAKIFETKQDEPERTEAIKKFGLRRSLKFVLLYFVVGFFNNITCKLAIHLHFLTRNDKQDGTSTNA